MSFFKGVSHVGIPTQNFDDSIKLYQKLGFELINQEDNEGSRVGFLQINDLMLEVYETETNQEAGAINHLAIDTDNAENAFEEVKNLGFELIDPEVMHLPFWKHGISYFNFYGPNHEVIEVCQKNKK
ncbi:VOC family protein [Lactiplantibacillus plantarum]|jgi:catechol 2,3-dioxygenase-like lactoylglutathione lyase family enzyme|uniref:VOC family protein n=1 Tax=Lactiplantibacillus plantarum TaxID=1590 RepID=UPI0018A032A2|nr:VOC family protein [Lactiplantibacillus plantarum]MDB7773077.1 VOC family protein [Lactiplantibacillus plantarum]